ncbi:MAG: hypothetical protein HN348_14050 [Proteobacteria bacterium]|nr:hypothetical protein [Pseudomonadota bacterium]
MKSPNQPHDSLATGQCHLCQVTSEELEPLYIRVSRSSSVIGNTYQYTVFVEVLGCPSCQAKTAVLEKFGWGLLIVLATGIPFGAVVAWILETVGLGSLIWLGFALPAIALVAKPCGTRRRSRWERFR